MIYGENLQKWDHIESQDMEKSLSIKGGKDKGEVFLYNGIVFNHKKEGNPFRTTQVDLEGIMLN